MSSIAENVYRVRERIANACARAGRDTESIRLIAVTKFVDTRRALPRPGRTARRTFPKS